MMFTLRNYDYLDPVEVRTPEVGAKYFDEEMLDYAHGSSICGEVTLTDGEGHPAPMLVISTAPAEAWRRGNTAAYETWIIFEGRAGATAAHRIARWLLRGLPLMVVGIHLGWIPDDIHIFAGEAHIKLPCWQRLAASYPDLVGPMPSTNTRPRCVVDRGVREARPEAAQPGCRVAAGRADGDI